MFEFILLERQSGVGILTLNRPERFNAWHSPMRHEVVRGLQALGDDDAVRAIVVTGAGDRAFSAGQDLAESQAFLGGHADDWMGDWELLYGAVRALDKPVIAALNGVAAGSAFQFALLCDIRIGHAGVRLGQTEINSGIPSITGEWVMTGMLGRSRTVELILTGRLMEAEEAHGIGLIHRLVPQAEVLPAALALARELAAKPPFAMQLNKQRLREISEPGFREAMASGHEYHRRAFGSGEPQAMMRRFFEERAARKAAAPSGESA